MAGTQSKLRQLQTDGALSANYVIKYNGTEWAAAILAAANISDFNEAAQDAVGLMVDANTLEYTDATPLLAVKKQMSIIADGSGLKLDGDLLAPGNNKIWGTNGSGVKGWYNAPSGADGNGIYSGDGTIGNGVAGSTTNAKLPAGNSNLYFDYSNNANAIAIANNGGAGGGTIQLNSGTTGEAYIQILGTAGGVVLGNGPAQAILYEDNYSVNTALFIDYLGNGLTPKAGIELASTTTGLLLPRLTNAQFTTFDAANGGATADGMMLYNTTTDTIKLRANGVWIDLASGLGGIYAGSGTIPGSVDATLQAAGRITFNFAGGNDAILIDDSSGQVVIRNKDNERRIVVDTTDVHITTPSGLTTFKDATTETNLPVYITSVGGTIDTDALLDVASTTKAFFPPRMTTAQITAMGGAVNDAAIVYDVDLLKLLVRIDGQWVSAAADGNGIYSGTGTIGAGIAASTTDANLPSGNSKFNINWASSNLALGIDQTGGSVTLKSSTAAKSVISMTNTVNTFSWDTKNFSINTDGAKLDTTFFITSTGGTIDPDALLDLNSITKLLYVPRMTTVQQPVAPNNGGIMYNTTTNKFQGRANGAWIDFSDSTSDNGIYSGGGNIGKGIVSSDTRAVIPSLGIFSIDWNSGARAVSVNETAATLTLQGKDADANLTLTVDESKLQFGTRNLQVDTNGFYMNNSVFIETLGSGSAGRDNSALLEIASITKGFLVPRMTTTQQNAIAGPANGLHIYNSTLSKHSFYEASAWKQYMVDVAGVGGIYKGSGTVAAACVATLTTNSSFEIKYFNGRAIYVDGTNGSEQLILQGDTSNRGKITINNTSVACIAGATGNGITTIEENTSINSKVTDIQKAFYLSGTADPASFNTTQNDWDIGDGGGATIIRVTSTLDNTQITGIAGGVDGRVIYLVNVGASSFRLMNDNAGSAAANRILLGAGASIIGVGYTRMLWYDGTASRWRYMEAT